MKHFQKLLLIFFLISFSFSLSAQSTSLKENLTKHVYTLAADSMQGRKAGTVFASKAADYIINEWTNESTLTNPDTIFSYTFGENGKYRNVIKVLKGNDEKLRDEYIVIGAHYDHLGVKNNQIYNGADDNASGTAALIEIGKALAKRKSSLKRSVILVAFDAEEIGLVGSTHFINKTSASEKDIKLMISVDMVGWYKASGEVNYDGSGTIKNGKALLTNPAIVPDGLNVTTKKFENSLFTATDTQPFAIKGIPTLAVTTGMKSPYHKPEDDAELIDYDGLTLITEHLINLVEYVANDTEYESSGKVAKKHSNNQLFNIGLTANIGSNYHHYTAGSVDGKTTTSYGAGLVTQFNFGIWGIRPEVHYDRIQAKHPDGKIATDNITIPLSLVLQTKESSAGFDWFAGGYYTYRFGGKQGDTAIDFQNIFNQTEYGLTFGFGFWVGPVKIGYTNRRALTNFTKEPNADNAHIRNRTNYFTVGIVF